MPSNSSIRPLSDEVINQIAAGEVVERPASIVKELLENSIDAGATRITVKLDEGGISRILIRDDGHGIAPHEIKLALARHHTSKLESTADLETIRSLGFRGEALASISSVARTTITSRTEADEHGWQVVAMPDAAAPVPKPVAHPRGTTIIVEDLFFNLPARRHFLKRPRTELLHCQQLIRRMAFCYPEVDIALEHDGRTKDRFPKGSPAADGARWRSLFGAEFINNACFISQTIDEIHVEGWVGRRDYSKHNSDLQYIAVNRRVVRDRHLAHAVRMAYESGIEEGRFAAYAIRVSLPAHQVDVNVHPGKAEVRFRDSRTVHDIVYQAVRLGIDGNTAQAELPHLEPPTETPAALTSAEPHAPRYHGAGNTARVRATQLPTVTSRPVQMLGNRYAVEVINDGLRFVDVGAAVQALITARLSDDVPRSRPLIIPEKLSVSLHDSLIAECAELGLEVTRLSEISGLIRAVPTCIADIDNHEFAAALGATLTDGDVAGALAQAAAIALLPPGGTHELNRWYGNLQSQLNQQSRDIEEFALALSIVDIDGLMKRHL